jgi:translocation and assembly module TamB
LIKLFKFILASDKPFNEQKNNSKKAGSKNETNKGGNMKILKRMIFLIFFFILVLWIAIVGLLQSEIGQQWAVNQLSSYIEGQTQARIHIKQIAFILPLKLRLHDVAIHKDQSLLLQTEQADFSCDWEQLFKGHLRFSTVSAKRMKIGPSILSLQTEQLSSQDELSWEEFSLPIDLNIQNLSIEDLTFDPLLVDQLVDHPDLVALLKHSVLQIEGLLTNHPSTQSLATYLHIEAQDLRNKGSPALLTLDLKDQQLSLLFHVHQIPFSYFDPSLHTLQGELICSGSARLQSWQELIRHDPSLSFPIEGHFKLFLNTTDSSSLPFTMVGESSQMKGHYHVSSPNEMQLFDVSAENPFLFLKGQATLRPLSRLIEKGEFNGEVLNVAHLNPSENIQGSVIFQSSIQGPFLAPEVFIELDSPMIAINQHRFHGLHATALSKIQPEEVTSLVTVELTDQHIPYRLSSSITWHTGQSLSLSRLRLYALESQMQGHLTYSLTDQLWEGNLEANASQLSHLSPLLPFPLQGAGHLRLQFKPEKMEGQPHQQIAYEWEGKHFQWTDLQAAHLLVKGTIDLPLSQDTSLLHLSLHLDGKEISWKDLRADTLRLTTQHQMPVNEIGNPSKWLETIQQHLSNINLQLQGRQVQWKDWSADYLQLNALVKDPLGPLASDLKFSALQVKTPNITFAELVGESAIDLTKDAWPFTLQTSGKMKEDLLLITNGIWHFDPQHLKARLHQLQGRYSSQPFRLLQPLSFIYEGEKTTLSGLHVLWGEAELTGHATLEKDYFSCQCDGQNVSSTFFQSFYPTLPINGRLSFKSHFEGPLSHPKGQLQLFFDHMQLTNEVFNKKPLLQGEALFTIAERGVNLKGTVHGIGNRPILTNGVLPITFSLAPFKAEVNDALPFQIQLQAEGELDSFAHLLYQDTTNLSGYTKIALNLHGKISAPQVNGHVDLSNGVYESLNTGAIYRNIQANLEGNGSKLILKRFRAQDQKNGVIEATGIVNLDASRHYPFEFQVTPTHIGIIDADSVTVSASGQLTLTGNRQRGHLKGTLTTNQAIVRLEETLPKQIKTVDVKYVNMNEEDERRMRSIREPQWPLVLDILLDAPQEVRIEGNHLLSEWKGSVHITGTTDKPLLNGVLRISRGQFDFNGKEFNLSQGSIQFAGPPGKKTTLYVVATKEIDRIRAEIIVKGPVNKLAISFRSNPPLAEREVLSYILFGRGLSDITPGEGEQLSQSFTSLNTQSSQQTDFLSRLRKNMGIDRLDITRLDPLDLTSDSSENHSLSLQIGRYISIPFGPNNKKKVFVSYNKSINAEDDRVALETELRKNIKAQVEMNVMGEQKQGKVMLKWKRDY